MFQDVWLRIVTSASKYRSRGKFRQWLFTVAHNRLVDHFRKQTKEVHDELTDLTDNNKSIEEQLTQQQQAAKLHEFIVDLPLEQRSALLLREEAGLSIRDIAKSQGVSVEAAKSRLRYAYQKLSRSLRKVNI